MRTHLLAVAATLLAAGTGCSNIDISLRGGDIGQSHARKQPPVATMSQDVQQAAFSPDVETAGGAQQDVQQAILYMPVQDAAGNVQLVAYPAAYGNCAPGGYGNCPPGGYGYGYDGAHHHGYPGGPFHGGRYGYFGGAHRTPGYPHHHLHREYVGPQGPPTAQVAYPYYTVRGPRDFLMDNPPSIGR